LPALRRTPLVVVSVGGAGAQLTRHECDPAKPAGLRPRLRDVAARGHAARHAGGSNLGTPPSSATPLHRRHADSALFQIGILPVRVPARLLQQCQPHHGPSGPTNLPSASPQLCPTRRNARGKRPISCASGSPRRRFPLFGRCSGIIPSRSFSRWPASIRGLGRHLGRGVRALAAKARGRAVD
jgi:hypothetical protein